MKNKTAELITTINQILKPSLEIFIKTTDSSRMEDNDFRDYVVGIDESARTYKDAHVVLKHVLDSYVDTLEMISKDKNNVQNVVSVKEEMIESISESVTFIGTLIVSSITKDISVGKKRYIRANIYQSIHIFDTITKMGDTLPFDEITGDVPKQVIYGLGSMSEENAFDSFSLGAMIAKFTYNVGKLFKQRQAARLALLEAQRNFLRLELVSLDAEQVADEDARIKLEKQKEYYKQVILEHEMEILELRD